MRWGGERGGVWGVCLQTLNICGKFWNNSNFNIFQVNEEKERDSEKNCPDEMKISLAAQAAAPRARFDSAPRALDRDRPGRVRGCGPVDRGESTVTFL